MRHDAEAPTTIRTHDQVASATIPWERSVLLIILVAAVVAGGWQLAGAGRGIDGAGGSAGEQPATEEPTTDEPAAEEPSHDEPPTERATSPQEPVTDRWPIDFSSPTDTVATFNNRRGDVVVVDLDTGRWAELPLPDAGSGNRSSRLWRVGDQLVSGSGRIWAISPGADEPNFEVGDADLSLPDTEPDRMWLIELPREPEDRGTSGMSIELTLADLSGEILASGTIHDQQPIRAVPGGLALRDRDGVLSRYNSASGVVEPYLSDHPSTVTDVNRDHVVWCENPCETLRITGTAGQADLAIDDVHINRFDVTAVWLSPDGETVATATVLGPGHITGREIRVYRTADSELLARSPLRLGAMYGDWRADSRQFFYWLHASNSHGPELAEIGRWSPATNIEQFDVNPFGTALGHVAVFPADIVDEQVWTDVPE